MTIMSNNMYALEGYKRVSVRGKGFVDVSTAYPEGVPRSMGRMSGDAVLMAKIARNNLGTTNRFSPGEVAYAVEQNDPRNTPLGHAIGVSSFRYPVVIPAEFTTGSSATRAAMSRDYEARVTGTTASRSASTGVAGGGTALARGGPAVGASPGGGLNLSGSAVGASPGGGLNLSGITGGIGSTITSAGTGAMSMVTQYLPLAIKVVLAIIAIKGVLWLMRGKK